MQNYTCRKESVQIFGILFTIASVRRELDFGLSNSKVRAVITLYAYLKRKISVT